MRSPQIVVLQFDDWLSKQLRELAADHRWLLREARQPGACRGMALENRPTVLVIQADPRSEKLDAFALLADLHRLRPDVAAVLVSDVKLHDDDRAAWAAAGFDLGARFVLFPPLSRPVLEDVVSGLMAATIRRTLPNAPPEAPTRPEPVIDLADERFEA